MAASPQGLVALHRAETADYQWGPNSPEDIKNFLFFRHGYKNVDIRRHFSVWEHGFGSERFWQFLKKTVFGDCWSSDSVSDNAWNFDSSLNNISNSYIIEYIDFYDWELNLIKHIKKTEDNVSKS